MKLQTFNNIKKFLNNNQIIKTRKSTLEIYIMYNIKYINFIDI